MSNHYKPFTSRQTIIPRLSCKVSEPNSKGRRHFPANKQFLDTRWVFYKLPQLQHCLPGDSNRFYRLTILQDCLPLTHFRWQLQAWVVTYASDPQTRGSHDHLHRLQIPVTSPDCYRHCWPIGYKSEVPKASSLGLISLLQLITEFSETFYLLDYQFIVRGYNSATARWKRWEGKVLVWRFQAESSTLPNLHVFTNKEALGTLFFGFLWGLHYTGRSD